jgi:hypothetical protein
VSVVSNEFVIHFPQSKYLRFEVPEDFKEKLKDLIIDRCSEFSGENNKLEVYEAP